MERIEVIGRILASHLFMVVHINENSWLAKLAAKKMRSKKVAMVLGRTVHLFNATKEEFISNEKWLNHELAHVRQYQRYGFFRFLFLYLYESARNGYRNNKFEVEARAKENDTALLNDVIIT